MKELEETTKTIVISLERYEELIGIETRTKIIAENIKCMERLTTSELLRIIGTEKTIAAADEIEKQNRVLLEKYCAESVKMENGSI